MLHKNVGVTCDKPFNDKSEVKKHIEFEYKETGSQRAEKRKHSVELESLDVKGDEEDINEELEIFERSSQEVGDRDIELKKNPCEKDIEKGESLNDEKILNKQQAWFEEEVKFQEMKIFQFKDKTEEEKKII